MSIISVRYVPPIKSAVQPPSLPYIPYESLMGLKVDNNLVGRIVFDANNNAYYKIVSIFDNNVTLHKIEEVKVSHEHEPTFPKIRSKNHF
jgi:hypothetical protein